MATCDICSATMKRGKPGGNKKSFQVTSLWDHLKAKHPGEHKTAVGLRDDQAEKRRKVESDRVKQHEVYLLQAKKQTTLEEAMSPELKWPVESVKQKDLERLLIMSTRICKFVALQWLEYGMKLSHNVVKYSQVYFAIYIDVLYVYIYRCIPVCQTSEHN